MAATTPTNLFNDLKSALTDFKTALDTNVPKIKQAFQALASLVPQITVLVDKLIGLMGSLKTAISNLDIKNIPGLAEASDFTDKTKVFLNTAASLLPDQAGPINDVLSVADVVSSLSGLGDSTKTEILALIDDIVKQLQSLKS
jgi:hypothetical protein